MAASEGHDCSRGCNKLILWSEDAQPYPRCVQGIYCSPRWREPVIRSGCKFWVLEGDVPGWVPFQLKFRVVQCCRYQYVSPRRGMIRGCRYGKVLLMQIQPILKLVSNSYSREGTFEVAVYRRWPVLEAASAWWKCFIKWQWCKWRNKDVSIMLIIDFYNFCFFNVYLWTIWKENVTWVQFHTFDWNLICVFVPPCDSSVVRERSIVKIELKLAWGGVNF